MTPAFAKEVFYTDSTLVDTVLTGVVPSADGATFLAQRFFRKGEVLYYVITQHDDSNSVWDRLFLDDSFSLDDLLASSKAQFLVGLNTKTKTLGAPLSLTREQVLDLESKHQALRVS